MFCCGKSKKSKKIEKRLSKHSEASTIQIRSQKPSPKQSKDEVDSGNRTSLVPITPKEPPPAQPCITCINILEDATILKRIFANLPVKELLQIRLVSKTWNKSTCELLRESMDGVIILQRGLGYYTKMMSSSIDIPIGRIFLNILDMSDPQPQKFFNHVGHSIYYLILNLEGQGVPQFQSCLPRLQNLKTLSLNLFNQHGVQKEASVKYRRKTGFTMPEVHILVEDYDETNNNAPTELCLSKLESIIMSCESSWKSDEPYLLEQLIRAAPNLKNLNLHKWPFPLKKGVFDTTSLEKLTFLNVGHLCNHDLKVLADKKLQVKSVEFQLDFDVEASTFDIFLESVSSTVGYLRLESQTNQNITFRMQTKMPRLWVIRLTNWVGKIWMDTVADKCENLQRLQLNNCDPDSISLKHPKVNKNVKTLIVNFGKLSTVSAKIRSDAVSKFVTAFPELEVFMMKQVSDKTLGQIVKGFPKLRTLSVTTAFGLTDSGLTGIPTSELSKMTKLEYKLACGCCLPVPVVDEKPCVDSVRQFPHIGELANLTNLSIESEEGSHFLLTNFSLHLGVHELTKLESLKITCHNELGPHWCFKSIADNLPNLKELTVMDRAISHDRYEEHELYYLLKRHPRLLLRCVPLNGDHSEAHVIQRQRSREPDRADT